MCAIQRLASLGVEQVFVQITRTEYIALFPYHSSVRSFILMRWLLVKAALTSHMYTTTGLRLSPHTMSFLIFSCILVDSLQNQTDALCMIHEVWDDDGGIRTYASRVIWLSEFVHMNFYGQTKWRRLGFSKYFIL